VAADAGRRLPAVGFRQAYHDGVLTRLLALARPGRPSIAGLAVSTASLAAATLLVWILKQFVGSSTESVYLLAVVAVGMGYGSWPAVGTAVASFLLYDFFFVQPYYTFAISAPDEWVDLLVFLVVAIAVGRLSALQLQRRREAELRGAEARAMFALSRDIATAATALEAAPLLAARLVREAEMARVWIGIGDAIPEERVVADTKPGEPRPSVASRWTLQPGLADTQPGWLKVREMALPLRGGADARELRLRQLHDDQPLTILRVPITAGGEMIGSLWATRSRGAPFAGRSHSRLMAAAGDQLGQSLVRDRLAAEATAVEVARQGDALKSALLDSVSHDLRTPLAAIRAAAGNLMDPAVEMAPHEAQAVAASIDREAERLNRLVRNMLDLGRIEGGALHPSLELYDLADLVEPVVERMRPTLAASQLEVELPADLPAVQVDAIFVDQILTNLLENAARYAAGKTIRVSARAVGDEVWLIVGDAGPGVPATVLPHVFERFYRAPRRRGSYSEGGSGIGLAVVKGLAEAMGGSVMARPSPMGGLEVIVRLSVDGAPEGRRAESTGTPEPAEPAEPRSTADGQAPAEPSAPDDAAAPAGTAAESR
jgi:two-component system, OmpR family, sensor histidine kinase KdpD